ncbi:hypothetical protein ACI65C_003724 [Semiaphis heraclei]
MVPPWWLLVAFVFGGVSAALTSSRVVRTKYGDVSGVIVTPDNRRLDAVEVFRGVPYASPPVGSLRFMPPVTGSLWSGVKVADRFGPVCPQRLPNVSDDTAALKTMARGRMQYLRRLLPYLHNQSEDCLYLNIYAPAQGIIVLFSQLHLRRALGGGVRCATDYSHRTYRTNDFWSPDSM